MGISSDLATVRFRAAARTGDATQITATANGTTTTIIDLDHASYQNNFFKGREVFVATGTSANLGLTRRVDSSTGSSGTITLGRALTAATTAGDTFHLYNFRDNGLFVNDWTRFVLEAYSEVDDTFLEEFSSSSVAFDRDAPAIELDDSDLGLDFSNNNIWGVWGIDYQTDDELWHEIRRADLRLRRYPTGANYATVEVRGRGRELAHGNQIRINAYRYPTVPTVYGSPITLDLNYVIAYAAGRAMMAIARRLGPDGAMAMQEAGTYLAEAQARKVSARTRRRPGTMKV